MTGVRRPILGENSVVSTQRHLNERLGLFEVSTNHILQPFNNQNQEVLENVLVI